MLEFEVVDQFPEHGCEFKVLVAHGGWRSVMNNIQFRVCSSMSSARTGSPVSSQTRFFRTVHRSIEITLCQTWSKEKLKVNLYPFLPIIPGKLQNDNLERLISSQDRGWVPVGERLL